MHTGISWPLKKKFSGLKVHIFKPLVFELGRRGTSICNQFGAPMDKVFSSVCTILCCFSWWKVFPECGRVFSPCYEHAEPCQWHIEIFSTSYGVTFLNGKLIYKEDAFCFNGSDYVCNGLKPNLA